MTTRASKQTNTPERRTGRSVHYTMSYLVQGLEHGTDGAIVLLHDIPAGAFAWQEVMSQLGSLNRAVYAFDMLGYGNSAHPWPADTSIWGHADVLTYLLRDLGLNNVILVGHGLGGGVAQILATRLYREQTAALVLINSICYLHSFAANWPLTNMEKRQDFDAPSQTELEDLLHDLRETLPAATNDPQRFQNVINDYITPWQSELGKEVLFQHIRLLVPYYLNAVASDLPALEKPILLVWGEQDEITPVKYAERLHREIPGSQLILVSNAQHMLPFDAPEVIADVLINFTREI